MKLKIAILISLLYAPLICDLAYIVNSGSETLSRIDIENEIVDNSFALLGSIPNRIALGSDFALIVNSGDNNIQKINLSTGNTEAYIYIGQSTNPYDIVISGNSAFVSAALNNKVYKIDIDEEMVVDNIGVGNNPAGLTIWQNKLFVGNTDYASGYQDCSISVIDLSSFTIEAEIPTQSNPQYLTEFNGLIHICCSGDWDQNEGKIQILDPEVNEIIHTFNLGGFPGSFGINGEGIIYLGESMNSGVYAYDGYTYEIIYDESNPFLPGGSSVSANDSFLAVLGGNWGENFTVSIYDEEELFIHEYEVGLYSTDIKLGEIVSSSNENGEITSINNFNIVSIPNPIVTSEMNSLLFMISSDQAIPAAELTVYNILGRKVKQFNSQIYNGITLFDWNLMDEGNNKISQGIYLYRLEAEKEAISRKILILK